MRIYSDLADWFHLLTPPRDYREEAEHITAAVDALTDGRAATLLELGSGGGNNASFLKRRFRCTLSDLSSAMLDQSRSINPECEHIEGDMRTLRLDRLFDVVLVHDAIDYMLTEDDLAAAITTAACHTRPGGFVILIPDDVDETYAPGTEHGGEDGEDGRALRYLMWTREKRPGRTVVDVEFTLMIAEPGHPVRIEYDHHECGLFPYATWLRLMRSAGLDPLEGGPPDPLAGEHAMFIARRASVAP